MYIRLIAALACVAVSQLQAADRLFLFDHEASTATVLAAPGLTTVGPARVGAGAFTALRARGRTYVVAAEQVTVLDDELQQLDQIPLRGGGAAAAALDAHTSDLLVAAGSTLYRIDTEANQIAAEIATGVAPDAIHIPESERLAYLLTAGSRQARVVDLESDTLLPGSVDLAATPAVFSGGLIGAGAEVFSLTPLPSGVGGVLMPATGTAALLAASPSGATLMQSSAGLLHRAADGTVTPLAGPGPVMHSALSVDGATAYLALSDGRVTSVDVKGETATATSWMASAPSAMALVSDNPQQQPPAPNILTKHAGDNQAVLSESSFEIAVIGPPGGVEISVSPNSPAAECADIGNTNPFGDPTIISCTANTVSTTTEVLITVTAVINNAPVDPETFTITIFPGDLPDGLFKFSGDNATVGAGGNFALVVESRIDGGLPNAGAAILVSDDSAVLTCAVAGSTTNAAGRATINCSVAASVPVSEVATITVSDASNSVEFTANIVGQTGSNDALTGITADPVTVLELQGFNLTVEATLSGVPQPNVPLTISGGGGIVTCPANATTGGNGRATIACGASSVNVNTSTQISITDGTNTVVYTVNVNNSTLLDGIEKVSGDNQSVPQNTQFPLPLVVRVLAGGQPEEGVLLTVSVNNSAVNCSVSTLTGADGLASVTCNAGSVAGVTQVEIQLSAPGPRTLAQPFLATVTPGSGGGGDATAITILSGANLSARVGDTLFSAVQVRTQNDSGTAVANTTVFARGPQGVTLDPATAQTDFAGLASFDVTFGCAPANGQILFGLSSSSTEAGSSYTLSAGPLNQFTKIQGDGQVGLPGQRMPMALVVESADQCGSPLPNVPLTWSVVPADAATLEAFASTTNSQGRASVLVRPTARGGAFQVVATATQDSSVNATFSLSTQNAPSQLRIVSGNQQSVPAGEQAADPLVVSVTNASNQPVQGVTVTFQVTSGAATLSSGTATTDAQGQAGVTLIAGALRGPVTVQANAAGRTVEFSLTIGGGAPILQQSGFVNGASFQPGFVSGSTGSIFGVNITTDIDGAVLAPYDPVDGFPTLFRGIRVTIEGVAAPILSLANVNGQEQINIQVPFGLQQGVVTVVVENNGSQATMEGVPVFAEQPGIFEYNFGGGQRLAAVLHADFSVVTPANPARPGEVLLLFATGLGRVTPPVATNRAGPVNPLAFTIVAPTVTLDGVSQEVLASVYAPQLITAYQINFRVDASAQPGLPRIRIDVDGSLSQEAFLPVGAAF